MRLLCVSDIHGNERALAAVLATAEKRGYAQLLVAGDLCFPGEGALAVWQRLLAARAVCVQGLSDKALARLDPDALRPRNDHERHMLARFHEVRRDLGEGVVRALENLPLTHRMPLPDGRELLLVHGSPADPTTTLTHDMTDDEIRRLLGDDPADLIVCGGAHVPFDRTVMDVRILGVGSVGEAPGPDPHADATFIDLSATADMVVEQIAIPLA
ncbi:MAG: metallophosphoesterase family protein [Polyangiaceae bacterium]